MALSGEAPSTLDPNRFGLTSADLRAISEWASGIAQINEVWLYGSRARGDHRPDSDVDLAVVVAGEAVSDRLGIWMFKSWDPLHLSRRVQLEWYD